MTLLLLMIPLSVLLLGAAVWAFAWAVRRGQFDDLDTPALQILVDDVPARGPPSAASIAERDRASTGAERRDDAR